MLYHSAKELHHVHSLIRLPDEIKHFYEFSLLKSFLFATVGTFIPIYIFLNLDFSSVILFISLAWGLFPIALIPIFAFILRKFGIEILSFLSILFSILEISFLFLTPLNHPTLIILSFLEALATESYWECYHASFGLFGVKKRVMEEAMGIWILSSIINILGPALAGIFISKFGFHRFFFVIVTLTIFVSIYLLRHFGKYFRVEIHFDPKFTLKDCPKKKLWILNGLYTFVYPVISIYLLTLLNNQIQALGFLFSGITLASALSSYLAGKMFDLGKVSLTSISPLATSAILLIYSSIKNPLNYLLEIPRGILNPFALGIFKMLYDLASKFRNIILSRSFYMNLSRFLFGIILYLTHSSLYLALLLGSIISLLYAILIWKEEHNL